jgi:hypothetical protein
MESINLFDDDFLEKIELLDKIEKLKLKDKIYLNEILEVKGKNIFPEVMDLKNSKIYKIKSSKCDLMYIGSTRRSLFARYYDHIINYEIYLKEGNITRCSCFELLKHGDSWIELYEKVDCEDYNSLLEREGKLIRENREKCVNFIVPFRTVQDKKADIKSGKEKEHFKNMCKNGFMDDYWKEKIMKKEYNLLKIKVKKDFKVSKGIDEILKDIDLTR